MATIRETVRSLLGALRDRRPVAYCRLVETRGSTPQKAGAMMLVFEDGSQAGTLGGGCVEAEVKRRAIRVLQGGTAEVATFQLDSDYGWDDGLICGGRMQILIEPIRFDGDSDVGGAADDAAAIRDYFQQLAELVDTGRGMTEVIVFDGEASGLTAPLSFLFDANDEPVKSLHASLDSQALNVVRDSMRPLASRPRPWAARGIAYLPTVPRCRLVIVGGGHVGKAVADLAADLDFDVWVVDDREEFVSESRFPRAEQRLCGNVDRVLPELEITPDTYCLIVTRGHSHDEEALFHLAERGACYVGMIGSRRKIKMIFDDLLNEGISAEALQRVHAPLGVDIGSQTVPEIAISICAELVSHRNRDGVVPGRPTPVEVSRA
ncbi:MAG: XdhC family protein [Pirellulaceae bacterium]|nr:XdhC family protein [Planctomycetales bacterium]MCA9206963.1 XdhC family protein [Planctomycetales bacterium]